MQKTHWIHKIHLPAWVVGVLALVLILRVPSFFEPYYYGDEMIYLSLGQGVGQGLTLYKEIFDNKPPLLYLTAAIAGNLFWFKAILCFWNIITVVFFYKLANTLFKENTKLQVISTLLFAILTTIPLFEGNIVNAELFLIGFSLIAFYILLSNPLKPGNIFFAGLMLGIGTLFKIPAGFDLLVIIVFWILTNSFKNWKLTIKNSFYLCLGFALPIIFSFVWFFVTGALPEYVKAAFMQNVGYLSSFRPGDIQKPFYIKNAPLLIRAGIATLGIGIIFLVRKKLSKKFILLCVWVLIGLFAITLSERPYPHYFVQIIAPISFLLGMLFADKTVEQAFVVLPLSVSFFVPVYYKFYYYQTSSYYMRFINFAIGKTNKTLYLQSFGSTVNRNYQIADFINKSSFSTDSVFMWDSDSAIVYALSRRLPPIKYVADYHVRDYSNLESIAEELASKPPKFIILTSQNLLLRLLPSTKNKYLLISQIGNANIYSRVDWNVEKNTQ